MKRNRINSLKKLAAALALPVISILFNPQAHAAPFTAGNIVVYRIGDGSAPITAAATNVFLDEYNTAGTLIQSIAMPTTSSGSVNALVAGNSTTEGLITRSVDGRYIFLTGYKAALGTASISGTPSATPRTVGRVDFSGNIDTSTALTDFSSGGNPRSVVSTDGTVFWVAGSAGGVRYVSALGNTTSLQINTGSGTLANMRQVNIFNGQLYYSDSSTVGGNTIAVGSIGSGTPTTSGQNSASVITLTQSSSAYAYFFCTLQNGGSGFDTLYVADNGGTIIKYALVSGSWTSVGTITASSVIGLTATVSGTTVTLFATAVTTTGGKIYTVTDTAGYNAAPSSTTVSTIVTAPANEAIRGVALAPISGVVIPAAPSISGVVPSSVTTNAGSTVTFALTANPGTPVATNFWYKIAGGSTNLVPGATTTILTLNNVTAADTASYFAILTNASGSATSSIVSLTVIDPAITVQPASQVFGLLDGTMQVSVSAAGTALTYQWYQYDGASLYTPLNNGSQTDGSGVFGATSSTLTLTNLQYTDATNLVVVVTGTFGAVTSSVVLLTVDVHATLAFWNFNQLTFPNMLNSPLPWFGVGTASPTNVVTELGSTVADPSDGPGFGLGSTNYAWVTTTYPTNGNVANNKTAGIQFNVSTVGAKNVAISYDARATSTTSDYERLQYTTNGISWTDYPTSSTFGGVAGSGMGGWLSFNYSLAGFPGVANNPNFGVRVVTEFQSTATYGVGVNGVISNSYVGTTGNYGTSGTATYDLVTFSGDAITNNNTPPSISSFINTNMVDTNNITLPFTVGDLETPAANLTVSAVSLIVSKVNPTLAIGGSGASRTLNISFPPGGLIPDLIDAAPILVTVTDGSGDSTATWFTLTVTSRNLPPTNSLTALSATNTLVNTPLTIPFTVGDDSTPVGSLVYTVASDNATLVPADPVNNIIINGGTTATPTLTIVPVTNQLGIAKISITVSDNDSTEPKQTTANIVFMVRPNTNIVAIDYFDYDGSGALDALSGGYWSHLSGPIGQMQVGSGVVTVDTLNNSENVQAFLLKSPYLTNSAAVLYSSFIVNMNPTLNPLNMPINDGTYFALFNDGSGVTGNYEGRVIAATNGAAPGFYRLGISDFGSTSQSGTMFPQDLSPNSNYVVVTSLVLSNGLSTLWVNPGSQSSASVTDPIVGSPTLFNIGAFELRQSGANGGVLNVSHLKVGTTFDSVFPSLNIQSIGANTVLNWSDATLGIQSTTNLTIPFTDVSGAEPPYTNNASTNSIMFFRFGQ
jgi:hypothetical protein